MASSKSPPSANGTTSPALPRDIMLDGAQLKGLSIPSDKGDDTADYKFLDGILDAGTPRSSCSSEPSSMGSPAASSSSLTKSKSSKGMKPKKEQSAYLDEETGTWKCRNCGGTYSVPNPSSRDRRGHKKECEESQRLKAIQREKEKQEEQERNARLSLEQEKALEGASGDHQGGDYSHQNGDFSARSKSTGNVRKSTDNPDIVGALNRTPVIPEKEEVNFGAPKVLLNHKEQEIRDGNAAAQKQDIPRAETKPKSSNIIIVPQSRREQSGAEPDVAENKTAKVSKERDLPVKHDVPESEKKSVKVLKEGDLPVKHDVPARKQGPADTPRSPLAADRSKELESVNDCSKAVVTEVYPNGMVDNLYVKASSPRPRLELFEDLEQVKHCSTAASNGAHLEGTLYHQLVDLHDDPQVTSGRSSLRSSVDNGAEEAVSLRGSSSSFLTDEAFTSRRSSLGFGGDEAAMTRSISLGFGAEEAARLAALNEEIDAALGKKFNRAVSLDNFGVARRDPVGRSTRFHAEDLAAVEEDYSMHQKTATELIGALSFEDYSRPTRFQGADLAAVGENFSIPTRLHAADSAPMGVDFSRSTRFHEADLAAGGEDLSRSSSWENGLEVGKYYSTLVHGVDTEQQQQQQQENCCRALFGEDNGFHTPLAGSPVKFMTPLDFSPQAMASSSGSPGSAKQPSLFSAQAAAASRSIAKQAVLSSTQAVGGSPGHVKPAKLYTPQTVVASPKQAAPYSPHPVAANVKKAKAHAQKAVSTISEQSQAGKPSKATASGSGQSGNSPPPEIENVIGAIVHNVRKHWVCAVAVAGVAAIAWVGKALTDRQQRPKYHPRGHYPGERGSYPRDILRDRRPYPPVDRYYWDDRRL